MRAWRRWRPNVAEVEESKRALAEARARELDVARVMDRSRHTISRNHLAPTVEAALRRSH